MGIEENIEQIEEIKIPELSREEISVRCQNPTLNGFEVYQNGAAYCTKPESKCIYMNDKADFTGEYECRNLDKMRCAMHYAPSNNLNRRYS